jgi:hypothetical protein
MTITCPPLHSIWESFEGVSFFVADIYDEATDPDVQVDDEHEPTFFVTLVPYADRDHADKGEKLDPAQWESTVEGQRLRLIGIERQC